MVENERVMVYFICLSAANYFLSLLTSVRVELIQTDLVKFHGNTHIFPTHGFGEFFPEK